MIGGRSRRRPAETETRSPGRRQAVDEDTGVTRALYEALAARDFDRAAELVAADALVLNVATGDVYAGRSGFLEFARGWSAAFPDLRFALLKIGGRGSPSVAEYEIEGTHTGPLVTRRGHVPPTGMEVHVRCCDVLEMEEGRISRIRSYFDSVTLLRQLGLDRGTPLHAPDRRAPLDLYAQSVDQNAPQRHKAVVHRFIQDVYNRQNPGAAVDTCSRRYAWHGGTLGEARGLAAYQTVLVAFFVAFPDLSLEVLDTVAEDDRVVVRFSLSGTHLGDFQGIPPTRRRVLSTGTNTYRIEDGRIVEEWWQGDVLVLLQQMDAAPSTVHLSS
jgi:predicted ester cyclase